MNESNHVIHNSDPLYSDLYSNGYAVGNRVLADKLYDF